MASKRAIEPEGRFNFRVVWGLGRSEDFATVHEAMARADELHRDMVETWPILAGTNDAVLPRIVEVEESAQ